ncbi:MAG: NPCBM/NEW2 domain-containing protein [Planctomycetes bacterium]|nr:NPCBM/NEW2 domain-containing protein [Planctomycetota bacterium]
MAYHRARESRADRGLVFALLAIAAAVPTARCATVATYDGQTATGETQTFQATSVSLGGTKIALADCDWIEPGGHASAAATRAAIWITLGDGGCLPATRIEAADIPDAIAVEGPLGPLVIPLSAVAGWGDAGPAETGRPQDRVTLESGALSGSVLGIADGMLRFKSQLDPKPLDLPVAKIQALRLATPIRAPKGVVLSVTLDPDHAPLLVLPKDGLPLAAAPTLAVGKALGGQRLRVEGGRRVYLGSLKLSATDEAGAFGVVWKHRIDADLDGGPLALGGVHFPHGLTVHSKARLAWDLGGAYERLHALAGISDLVAPEGDCQVALLADGKPLWMRDSVKGSDKPITLDLDVSGVKTLELQVEYGARYDIGDHVTLADAWLLKTR